MHILKKPFLSFSIEHPYAAVKVKVKTISKNTLEILPGIFMLKAGTKICYLPDTIEVITADKEKLFASGKFAITVETINPYHILIDHQI